MLALGPLAFAAPWILGALAALPVIWWLLRVTPPSPRVVRFPAIVLLRDLIAREETPARTPWWLLLLRLALAALVIMALAQPLLNPNAALPGSGPLVVAVDTGWGAGRDWPGRRALMLDLVDQASREGREVVILPTAPTANGDRPQTSGVLRAVDARRTVQSLDPVPWPNDRAAAREALAGLSLRGSVHAVWLSDGLGDANARALAEALQALGSLTVVTDGAGRQPKLVLPPATEGGDLTARVVRAEGGPAEAVTLRVTAGDGRLLTRETGNFAAGSRTLDVRLPMPTELRNEAATLRIEGETTAGATVLLDERWRRRPVGLVSGRPAQESQPLLSDLHYLDRALSPTSEVRRGTVQHLLERETAVLILSDVGALSGPESTAIQRWMEQGGVLVRFAGPRLAQHADALIPVRLRAGDRQLGGALSWQEPASLAPFTEASPFFGLPVPADVAVTRQVLAEPAIDLAEKTWATLADGTPLVTGAKRGEGFVVLVHTTASPDWSNLALSGLFVNMLRRLTAMSEGVAGPARGQTLSPLEVLDGLGRLVPAPPTAFPVPGDRFRAETIGPRHPPGFYGTADARQALNLTAAVTDVRPLPAMPPGVALAGYGTRGETDLKPWLLGAAMALAILDFLIALVLRGVVFPGRTRMARRAVTAAGAAAAVLVLAAPAFAQSDESRIIAVTGETHLAFVVTGDREQDLLSRAGLDGLTQMLARRTSIEAQGAVGVDPEVDELGFYPLLYWPMTGAQVPLSPTAQERLNAFLRNGGTILFDTRDSQLGGFAGNGPGTLALRRVTAGLDVPPLATVPPDHVLTKAFYLLQEFPGRYAGGDVWIEARETAANDGVSPIIVGGADWAAAWAVDGNGRPMAAVMPGGERQREMAYRFGVNLLMYVLTGNYKADQVHVPAILERLGQ